jgi:acyl carrier protein
VGNEKHNTDEFYKIVAEFSLNDNDILDHALLTKDLGMDSLDVIETVYSIESHYDIEFDDKIFSEYLTVQELKKQLINLLKVK